MFRTLAVCLVLALCSGAQSTPSVSDVQNAVKAAGLVPDLIPTFNPTALIDVVYTDPATKQNITVTPGQNLIVEQTTNEPQFFLTSSDASLTEQTFVLAMVDPDAPTPQNRTLSDIRHVLAPNVRVSAGSTGRSLLINSTPALTEYLAPGPPPGSDPHRYTVLLYQQPENFNTVAAGLVDADTARTNFNFTSFIHVTGLGDPIAGNFWLTGPADATAASSSSGAPSPSKGAPASSSTSGSPSQPNAAASGLSSDLMDLAMVLMSLAMYLRNEI